MFHKKQPIDLDPLRRDIERLDQKIARLTERMERVERGVAELDAIACKDPKVVEAHKDAVNDLHWYKNSVAELADLVYKPTFLRHAGGRW